MKTAGAIIAILLAVGGALAGFDTFYARRQWAEERFAGYDQQLASTRLNQVDGQIVQIENEKRRRQLSQIEQDLLRRLYHERRQLVCALKIEKC